jgi:hypothetical protein
VRQLNRVIAAAATVVGLLGAAPTAAHAQSAAATIPAGVTAGYVVFDRQTGTVTTQLNPDMQFRSASVVKLLIALDHLKGRGPDQIPAADRSSLDVMLRSSDDHAAGSFWAVGGKRDIITRMARLLNLPNTVPPPPSYENYWGYTAITAADTVRIYRYLLDTAPAPERDYIMGNLRQSTRCGTDGFDQSFGIPSAFARPWAVKQGWSGFGSMSDCIAAPTARAAAQAPTTAAAADANVDLTRPALHTTGTVGNNDRSIVAIFTLEPVGTSFSTAANTLTTLTRSLSVPGATPASGTWFSTWGTGVKIRADATTATSQVGTVPAGRDVAVRCQKLGQEVQVGQYKNAWWAYLPQYGGYMTNIYIHSPDNKLPGVPDC